MNVTAKCPICFASTGRSLPAHMAPFIIDRARAPFRDVRSFFCSQCTHVFFSPSLTTDELGWLYENYRSSEYNRVRLLHEPEYASTIEERDGANAAFSRAREAYYDYFFADLKAFKGAVADYGGGDSYFCRYALPYATVTTIESDFEQTGGNLRETLEGADFLMCQHVFEHIAEPTNTLSDLARALPLGALCYIELPLQYSGPLEQAFCDLENMYERGEALPWDPIVTLHEHLNHFSKSSLGSLLRRSGFNPVEFHQSSSDIFGAIGIKI